MTAYHLFLSASWPTTCLVGQKSIAKVPNQKVATWPKCFSSFFFFFFFRRATSKLRDSFMMVFAQNSSILHWAVHSPSLFEVSWGSSNRSLNNYGFISDAIFEICWQTQWAIQGFDSYMKWCDCSNRQASHDIVAVHAKRNLQSRVCVIQLEMVSNC